jgi:acetolactate synthase-1/2/3 large subunit
MDRARAASMAHAAAAETDLRFPIYPPHLVREVREAMPSDGVVCLDNGIYKIWFARNYPARAPNTVLLDNALAAMGAGLPSAMASAMIFPQRKVLAVCGDGGFLMNSQELETAVRLKLNLTILILNDGSYGMVRWKQANMGFADFGLTYGDPDFVAYARSYGASGFRVETAASLAKVLRGCLDAPGVNLIDCPVDYADNDAVLNHEIRELSAAI